MARPIVQDDQREKAKRLVKRLSDIAYVLRKSLDMHYEAGMIEEVRDILSDRINAVVERDGPGGPIGGYWGIPTGGGGP